MTGLKILHVIFFLLLLGSGDFQVPGLTATGKNVPTEAHRGEDVTIPCMLSGIPTSLNLQFLSVVWTLRSQNGTENKVYQLQGSHHQSLRNGSRMNDSDLKQGNASLYISNIQIEDEGDYRCFVIVTPYSSFATSTLHVSVKPQTNLQYIRLIEVGFPGSVFCEVSNFYPEEVKIRWVKHSQGITTKTSLDRDVSLTMPLRNSDGTFNVTSVLTVWASSRDEPGDLFSCIVSHRSLMEEMTLNFIVPRWNPMMVIFIALLILSIVILLTTILKENLRTRCRLWMKIFHSVIYLSSAILICFLIYFMVDFGVTVWIYIILSFAFIMLLIALAYYVRFLWKYFKTGELTISEISGDQCISHMKRTTLTCQITNFRLKQIQIKVYLKRCNDKKHFIASWESTDLTSSNNSSNCLWTAGGKRDKNSYVLTLLEEVVECSTLLPVEMEVEMTKSWFGMYKCHCSITITPNKDRDDNAVLGVKVEHASLKQPTFVCRTLKMYSTVVGKPVISPISGERWITHMKRTTLSCQITNFKLKEIHINVYLKRRNDRKNHLIRSWVPVDLPSGKDNTTAGHQRGDIIEKKPLLEDVVSDTSLHVEVEVEMTETKKGRYKCDCRISLTPNIDTDDGAVLTVEVDHATLTWPKYEYQILNVIKGDKPSLWRRWKKSIFN